MNQTTLIVPSWIVDGIHLWQRNWIAFVGTLILCVIVIAVTALIKGGVNIKHTEERAKQLYVRFNLLLTTVLAAISSLLYFLTENTAILKNLPYVGEYVLIVIGVVRTLYAAGLKFKSIEEKGAAWATPTQTSTATQPPQPTDDNQFLGQG